MTLRWVPATWRVSLAFLILPGLLCLAAVAQGNTPSVAKPIGVIGMGDINSVSLSPDTTRVAASGNLVFAVFETETGDEVTRIVQLNGTRSIEYSPDGTLLVTASDSGARVWDAESFQLLLELPTAAPAVATRWSPDGDRLLVGDESGSLVVWSDGLTSSTLVASGTPLRTAVWHPGGELVAFTYAGGIRIIDAASGVVVADLNTNISFQSPRVLDFSPDGQRVLVSGFGFAPTSYVWAEGAVPILHGPVGLSGHSYRAKYHRESGSLYLARSGTFPVLRVETAPGETELFDLPESYGETPPLQSGFPIDVSGGMVAVGSPAGLVIWDISNRGVKNSIDLGLRKTPIVRYSKSGDIYTLEPQQRLIRWNRDGAVQADYPYKGRDFQVSPDDRYVAIQTGNESSYLYPLTNDAQTPTTPTLPGLVRFSPDGEQVAIYSYSFPDSFSHFRVSTQPILSDEPIVEYHFPIWSSGFETIEIQDVSWSPDGTKILVFGTAVELVFPGLAAEKGIPFITQPRGYAGVYQVGNPWHQSSLFVPEPTALFLNSNPWRLGYFKTLVDGLRIWDLDGSHTVGSLSAEAISTARPHGRCYFTPDGEHGLFSVYAYTPNLPIHQIPLYGGPVQRIYPVSEGIVFSPDQTELAAPALSQVLFFATELPRIVDRAQQDIFLDEPVVARPAGEIIPYWRLVADDPIPENLVVRLTHRFGEGKWMLQTKWGEEGRFTVTDSTTRTPTERGSYELLPLPEPDKQLFINVDYFGADEDLAVYELEVLAETRYLSTVAPRVTGNMGRTTFRATGWGLEDAAFSLEQEGATAVLDATEVIADAPNTAFVGMDLEGVEPGLYDLTAQFETGEQSALPNAILIGEGGTAGKLEYTLSLPEVARARPVQAVVTYSNSGGADLIAPMLEVSASNGALLQFQGGDDPPTTTLRILATGFDAYTFLPPGLTRVIPIIIHPVGDTTITVAELSADEEPVSSIEKTLRVIAPIDPNELVATPGIQPLNLIDPGTLLHFTVYFENLSTASAPAQEVFIDVPLFTYLDWGTFELQEVAFGDVLISDLTGLPKGKTSFPLETETPQYLHVEAGMDLKRGRASWALRTLDANSHALPDDPFAGFLPPNDETNRGQGHVSFTVRVRAPLNPGTQIHTQAIIVFDTEAPIITNTVTHRIAHPFPHQIHLW